ncbi:hypothetical protein GUJ93_ZPchr0004g39712 [Zizania palustris]|uniref:Uncharacterized protein n=1 Tax=Zizania palustris TaxID=103762 RepID=A0A8J5SID4_ZIZPA|nr:hypothetical protein GUJ93_ZPchr0004g39712 [Zizania palustris]
MGLCKDKNTLISTVCGRVAYEGYTCEGGARDRRSRRWCGGCCGGQRWWCGGCRGGTHGLRRRRRGGCYGELRGQRAWPGRVAVARGLRREARAMATWGLRWEATGAAVAWPVWVAAAPVLWRRRGLRGGYHRKRRGQDGEYKNSRSNQA